MSTAVQTDCCQEKRKLAEAFAIAARQYSEAAANFARATGGMAESEFERLRMAVREGQQRSERAGTLFEEHLKRHGCWMKRDVTGACRANAI